MLPYISIVSVGSLANKIMSICRLGCLYYLLQGGILFCKTDVGKYTAGKKEGLLQHHANLGMKTLGLNVPEVTAVQGNTSLIHIIKSHNQINQCGFTGTGSPHKTDHFPCLHGEIDVLQHRFIGLIAEGNIPELKITFNGKGLAVLAIRHLRFLIQHIVDTVQAGDHLHYRPWQVGHPAQGTVQIAAVGHKLYQLTYGHSSLQHINASKINRNIGSHTHEEGQDGKKHSPEGLILSLNGGKFLCFLCELRTLPLLLPEGLHNTHAGNDILKIAVHIIELQPLSVENGMNAVPEHSGNHDHHQNKHQRQ